MRVWRSRCSVEREMFVLRIFVADKFFETRGSGPRAEPVRVQGNGLNKNTVSMWRVNSNLPACPVYHCHRAP